VRISLSRLQAARILKEAERKSDEEKLRSALLASVSHDLKTPLVTMLGAATSLRDLHEDLGPADSAELLDCIISESGRLESYIQNLLDMTRLGHGPLALSRAWVSVEEIWHVVEKRVARLLANHKLRWRQQGDIPVLHVHPALIEQALFNALDNALKAGGIEQEILVEATWRNDTVTLLVCDHGPGLPPSEWEAVFDQFYTFSLGDRYEKGTGLGLSICRSIFRVHGGDARIVPPPAGFSHCLELTLPVTRTSADSGDEQ
jgi:two-component system sensor histidine kinase KdpD